MLSTQVTIVAQTSISSASSMALPTIALRSSRVSRRPRSSQQSRAFRLGLWSSYLDPNFQKEIQRRHRIVKHKYMEAINRKLSWDRQLPDYAKNLGFKGIMCSARLRGRWMNNDPFDDPKSEPKKDTGNGIEDVEADALDRLKRKEDAINEFIRAKSRLFHRNYGFPFSRGSETTPSEPLDGAKDRFDSQVRGQDTYSSSQEYEIDPITNRKVFKNITNDPTTNTRKPIQVPVKTFKGYRTQFSDFEPPSSSTTEPTNQNSSLGHALGYKTAEIHGSAKGQPNKPETESKAAFDEPTNSTSVVSDYMINEARDKCNFIQELLKSQDPEVSRESEGQPAKPSSNPDSAQRGLKDFDEKIAYDTPFGSYKPSQKPQKEADPVQEGLESYDSKMSYDRPFMASDPVGQDAAKSVSKPDPVQEGLRIYDQKVSYKPFDAPHSISANAKYSSSEEDGLRKFDSKMCYGKLSDGSESKSPVIENVGQSSDPVQEGLKAFDSKMSYDKPHMVYDTNQPSHVSEKRNSIWEFVEGYNSDSPATPEAKDPVRESLRSYENRYPYPESRTESNSKESKSDNRDPVEDGLKRYDSQHSYGPVYYDEPFAKPSNPAQPTSFVKSTPRKMTGNFVRDFPEEFETKWTSGKSTSGTLVPDDLKTIQHLESKVQNAEKEYINGLASQETFSRKPDTPRIQTSLDRGNSRVSSMGEEKTLAQSEQDTKVPYAKAAAHQGEGDLSVLVSSYGTSKRDKQSTEQNASKVQESAKTQGSQGLVDEVRKIYEDKFGTIDLLHRHKPEAADKEEVKESTPYEAAGKDEVKEPTLYKILAYDQNERSVSIADTTSIVPDSASPLTPSEVLLRLSNPAKFFPHFESLQSQGYEIVSGGGDMLIFRKVREAAAPASSSEPDPEPKRTSTNPIDGMQSSPIAATGNFASPTGFVNHDLPIRTEPVFKSGIDVRREEPVFSGKRSWYDEHEHPKRKTPGIGKRMITGAVGLGAFAYATGVVFEFFKTGGIDGRGPQGF